MIYEQRNVQSACNLNDFTYVNDNTNLSAHQVLSCFSSFLFIYLFFLSKINFVQNHYRTHLYNRSYGKTAFDSFAQVINEILRSFAPIAERHRQFPKLFLLFGFMKKVILSACVIPVTTQSLFLPFQFSRYLDVVLRTLANLQGLIGFCKLKKGTQKQCQSLRATKYLN